jgi:hypothetical protein
MDKSIPIAIIIVSAAIMIGALLYFPAIPQDSHYHDFADQRKIFAIPHFFNVITNAPFLVIGWLGMRLVAGNNFSGGLPELRTAYATFFSGILLVGLGSSFYHLSPNNESLIWDRLPMTISFMALFSIIIGENIDIESGKRLLYPSVILGILSVIYWYWGEIHGQGDLRFYALIQFLPMLLIPAILALGRPRFTNNGYLWGLLGAYAAAKLAEYGDDALYQLSGFFSGHSLKHLLAATGVWSFYLGLKKRVRLSCL